MQGVTFNGLGPTVSKWNNPSKAERHPGEKNVGNMFIMLLYVSVLSSHASKSNKRYSNDDSDRRFGNKTETP